MKKTDASEQKDTSKRCDHSILEKEYILGSSTGDYICTSCGQAGWGSDWPEKKRNEMGKSR